MSIQTIEINSVKISFDAEKTRNYRTEFNQPCSCQECRNFYKHIQNNAELVSFLCSFGIDYNCTEDVFSWDEGNDRNALIHHEGYYGVFGIIEGEEFDFEKYGVNISFQKCACVPCDRTGEYFWICIAGDFPYILDEERDLPPITFSQKLQSLDILDKTKEKEAPSMKAFETLPEGYREIYSIDLQKDKKMSFLVNLLALLIAALLIVPVHFYIPITSLFGMENGYSFYMLRLGVFLVSIVAYMVLHELVHGVAMKLCGTKKIKYGFTGLYAFAGSNDYYDKKSYIFIALAPVVLWGIVIALVNPFVSTEWFWPVYMIQVINLSGAAGDLFVTVRFSRFPKDILIKDHGVGMTVFSRQ